MQDWRDVFFPVTLSGVVLPSRLFLAAINTGFAESGGPSEALIRFHESRSGPEIGISMVGNVAVAASGSTNPRTAVLQNSSNLGPYGELADRIRARGSLPGIQLSMSLASLAPGRNWVTKDRNAEQVRLRALVAQLDDREVQRYLDQFVIAARLAASVGFSVIQLHAAHGYFLSLLLSPLVNGRAGRFAHSSDWLDVFAGEFVAACGEALVSSRISMRSGLSSNSADELLNARSVAAAMVKAGVDMLDFSAGFYTVDRRQIYPGIEKGPLPAASEALRICREVGAFGVVSGNISDLRSMPPISEQSGIAVGRALIADPDFARKSYLGMHDEIVRCRRTAHCHYFSRGKNAIECGVNSSLVRLGEIRHERVG